MGLVGVAGVDKRLLTYYERELRHLRENGAAFAREYPKVASRLGIAGTEVADPYVERLLEGFAFLTARVQLKLDAEYPRFSQGMLEAVCPHHLAPTPSMCVVQFHTDPGDTSLASGLTVARGSSLRGQLAPGEQTACEFRTAQDVTLWSIRVEKASYHTRDVAALGLPEGEQAPAAIRLVLRTSGDVPFREVGIDRLLVYLAGGDQTPFRIYEQLFADARRVLIRGVGSKGDWSQAPGVSALRPVGLEPEDSVLPASARSFHGHRLVQEYFAFPRRFLFAEIAIDERARDTDASQLELVITLNRADLELESAVDASCFALHCAPAVNAFPKRLDRVQVSDRETEHHAVPDKTRPLDFEVHTVTGVEGFGASSEDRTVFRTLYGATDRDPSSRAYFTVHREPRVLSAKERQRGRRSPYTGSEVFIALVDQDEAPYGADLKQIGVEALCTNRDLPLRMPIGSGRTDFTTEAAANVTSVRVVAGPTPPRPTRAEGNTAWRLISHLSLNYLSLIDADDAAGADALRGMLALYGETSDAATARQIEGVRSVRCEAVVRRVHAPGPITFARGLGIRLLLDEAYFEGTGVFVLASVLDRFFAGYAGVNSFTETMVGTDARPEIKRWPARAGEKRLL